MSKVSMLRPAALALAVACALGTVAPAHADDARQQALEARVDQLEKQVQALLAELKAQKAAAPAAVAAAPAPAGKPGAAPIQTTTITPGSPAGTTFTFGGFVKADGMFSKYSDGEIASGSAGRDFYVPGTIPVGGAAESTDYDAHVKNSRLWFGTDTVTDSGAKIGTKFELEFFGGALGDERATNTYGATLRHAYATYDEWLFGQTWSNFQDVSALPDGVDFIGPTDGTVFVRQPQLRYTSGPWSFSIENSETTITPFHGGARITSSDNSVPDLTARYTWKQPWGYLSIAALGRQLKDQTTGSGAVDDSVYTLAGSFSGKINVGKDDVRFMITGGDGIGRYVGLNFANDAVLDSHGELDTISGVAGFAAYRHLISPQWRANLILSGSHYDNDVALTGSAANKSTRSAAVNLIYSPQPKLDVGFEYRYANRELESGADGDMKRFQMMMKYTF